MKHSVPGKTDPHQHIEPGHQTKREAWLPLIVGAGDEARTRDLNLGKVALYQLSYSRMVLHCAASHRLTIADDLLIWSGRRGSNSRPQPWQGCALPAELLPHLADFFMPLYCLFFCHFVLLDTPR